MMPKVQKDLCWGDFVGVKNISVLKITVIPLRKNIFELKIINLLHIMLKIKKVVKLKLILNLDLKEVP